MNQLLSYLRGTNFTRLIRNLLIVLWVILVIGIAYFITSLDVVKDWRLILPNGPIHAGDTIVVESKYTKLIDVTGTAKRYIECEARDGVFVSYPVNEAEADRAKGTGGTGIEIVIPRGIPDLPTTCKIRVGIDYKVLPFRTVHETNTSKEFQLLPETEESKIKRESETVSVSTPQTLPSPVQSLNLPSSTQSTTTSTTESVTNSTETTQPMEPMATVEKAQPTLFDRITDIIRSLGN